MWAASHSVGRVKILRKKELGVALETRSDQTDHCVEQESLKKTATKAVFLEVKRGTSRGDGVTLREASGKCIVIESRLALF